MATTGILRTRRSAAQRHALASVEREIGTVDRGRFRKYIRNFHDAYKTYRDVVSGDEVKRQIAGAGIVLFADYHALPNSQNYVASLLDDSDRYGRPMVLGIETIVSRDQHILDEWQRGEIDEAELRERVRFDLDWGYDWDPFYELLCAARYRGVPVYGMDCMPRDDLRKIHARDRHAADRVAAISADHPDALILVLFGESHLAPQHLPALIQELLPQKHLLTVLMNVDALYWRAAGESHDRVEAVQVSEDVVCLFNATPLEKYENYRLYLDRWGRDDDSAPDAGPTFYNLVDGMVRFLGFNKYSPHNTTQPKLLVDAMPEVHSRTTDALLRRLLSRKGFTPDGREHLLRRVRESGSVYLAPINAVYVREFRMEACAEDATRFLHQACRGLPNRREGKLALVTGAGSGQNLAAGQEVGAGRKLGSGQNLDREDSFYIAVLEHALAFFGSRVLHPARPAFRDADLCALLDVTREDLEHETGLRFAEAVNAVQFLQQHRETLASFSSSARGNRKAALYLLEFNGRTYQYIIERLGYLTGSDIYDAYIEGKLSVQGLRKLFLTHIERPNLAFATYRQLSRWR